jgi:hypothetical protein
MAKRIRTAGGQNRHRPVACVSDCVLAAPIATSQQLCGGAMTIAEVAGLRGISKEKVEALIAEGAKVLTSRP